MKFAFFKKGSLVLNSFYSVYKQNFRASVYKQNFRASVYKQNSILFINKTLGLNNLKTRTAMNVKISKFVICVKGIIHLLLYNLHDCVSKVVQLLILSKFLALVHLNRMQRSLTQI